MQNKRPRNLAEQWQQIGSVLFDDLVDYVDQLKEHDSECILELSDRGGFRIIFRDGSIYESRKPN